MLLARNAFQSLARCEPLSQCVLCPSCNRNCMQQVQAVCSKTPVYSFLMQSVLRVYKFLEAIVYSM